MIRYSTVAEQDLQNIIDYTVAQWGEAQADNYLSNLIASCELVEKMPKLGRSCKAIHPAAYRIERGQHVILYLQEPTGIFVCRVLHQRMLAHYEDFLSSFAESIP